MKITQFKKRELNAEEIACYKRQLEIAEPYTYEEIVDIPYDSCDFDLDRICAYNAQRALREAGILLDD